MKKHRVGIRLAIVVLFAHAPVWVDAITWSGGGDGTSWNDPANWSGGVIPGPYVEAYFSANTGLSSGKILSLDASQTVGQIQFYGTTVDCSIGSASDIGNGNTLSVLSVLRAGNLGGTQTLAADVVLPDDSVWNIGSGGVGLTVSGSIGGSGKALTKIGNGLLTLGGDNTYSGGTSINAGTLALGHANALGTSGTVSFGGGTLKLFNTTDLSARFSQGINQIYAVDTAGLNPTWATPLTSVGGRLVKNGTGTLTLGAANSYTGSTTVNAGTLTFSGAGSLGSTTADVTVNGGILDIATASPMTVGTLNIASSGAVVTNGTLTASKHNAFFTGSATVYASLAGSGTPLFKGNSGTVTLSGANSYTGRTTVNGGNLTLNYSAGTAPASNIIDGSSPLTMGPATLTLTGKNSTSVSQTFNGLTLDSGAAAFTMSTGNSAGSSLMTLGSIARNTGATVNFAQPTGNTTPGSSNGYVTSTGNNDAGIFGAYATVANADWAANNGVNITAYTDYATLAGAGPSIADGATSNVRVTSGSTGDIGQDAATITINTLLVNDAAARKVTLANGNTLRLGSLGGILKTGAGALTLGSAGDAGTLTAGGADNTAGEIVFQNATTVTNYATLANNGSGAVAVTKSGAGTLALMAASTFTGGLFMNAGTLFLPGGINPLATNSALSIAGGTINLGGAIQTNTTGIVILGGTVTNGTLAAVDNNIDAQAGTVTAVIAGPMGITKTSPGTLTLTGSSANTFTGTTTILEGNIHAGVSGVNRTFIPGNLTVGSPEGGPSASLTVPTNATVWDKLKDLTVYPNGSVNFGGAAQSLGYWTGNAGTTWIIGGTLTGGQLYNYRQINMAGGTLGGGVYGGSTTIASVATNTTAVVSAYVNIATTCDVGDGVVPVDLHFSGSMGPSASLTKKGAGTMLISTPGGNGGSTVTLNTNGGTLLVNNGRYGSGTGSGLVTVNAGSTLGGVGVIGGLVNYTNANVSVLGTSGNPGTLWPGSVDATTGDHVHGTLTVGSVAQTNNVTIGNNARMKIAIGPSGKQDRLTVYGVLNLASTSDSLVLDVSPDARGGTYVLASATGGITGSFNSVPSEWEAKLTPTATTLELTIPEKGTLLLLR